MGFLNAPGKLLSKIPGAKTLNKPVNKMLSKTPGLRNVPQKFGMAPAAPKPVMGGGLPNSQGQGFAQQLPAIGAGESIAKTMNPAPNPMAQDPSDYKQQKAIPTLQSPYDAQQAGPAIGGSNNPLAMDPAPAMAQGYGNPMQQANEQMQGYEGPDLGSQDPREIARTQQMQGMSQLYGSAGRPDVMPRGLGPSNPMEMVGQAPPQQMNPQQMMMDENGLEPRRGAR